MDKTGIHKHYLTTFTLVNENIKCLKAGITSKFDVFDRFKEMLKDGVISNFKIHKSSWFKTKEKAYESEQRLFNEVINKFGGYNHKGEIKFHNFWTKDKYNGITEIRKYNYPEYKYMWDYLDNNGKKYLSELKNNE